MNELNHKDKTSIETSKSKNAIIFCGGEKGGVGKSFLTRILLDYAIAKGWKNDFILVEADPAIKDVSSIYSKDSNNFDVVTFSDNKFDRDEPDAIVNRVVEKTVIVNLPSNIERQFNDWVERIDLFSPGMKKHYSEVIYFFVSDGCVSSVKKFISHLENYSDREMEHCLVLNPGRLTSRGNFKYLESEYKPLIETIKSHNVPVIYLPELQTSMQFICDRDEMTYRELMDKDDLTVAFGVHINKFCEDVDSLFDQIFSNRVNSLKGLIKIAKEQKEERDRDKLPSKIEVK